MTPDEQKEAEEFASLMKRAGIPTFDEYQKMSPGVREKRFRRAKDNAFRLICDNIQGISNVKKFKHYFIANDGTRYDCGGSIDRVDDLRCNEGLDFDQIAYIPELREYDGPGYVMEVTWMSKTMLEIKKAGEALSASL